MYRFSLLALLTAASCCVQVGAQDVIIVEKEMPQGKGNVRISYRGSLQGFPPEITLDDRLSISSKAQVIRITFDKAAGPNDVRWRATVVFETPDGKRVIRKDVLVGYKDKGGKLKPLTFTIATDLGNETFTSHDRIRGFSAERGSSMGA
jgi:hypothetical protein